MKKPVWDMVLEKYRAWEAQDRLLHPDRYPLPLTAREPAPGAPIPKGDLDYCPGVSDHRHRWDDAAEKCTVCGVTTAQMASSPTTRPRHVYCKDLPPAVAGRLLELFNRRLVSVAGNPALVLVPVLHHVFGEMSRAHPGWGIPSEVVQAQTESLMEFCERVGEDPLTYRLLNGEWV